MKKTISLLLLICLLFVLTACGGGGEESAVSEASDETSVETDQFVAMNGVKNWGGTTLRLLTHNQRNFSTAIIPETQTGEPINDAFFMRNALIEEKYGITLELDICTNPHEGANKLRNDIDSGMNDIDIVALPLVYIAPLGVEGKLLDFNSLDNGYLHLDQPWWDQTVMRDLTLKNKVLFLAGDALVEDDEATWAVYFNKDLRESYNLENPYDLVREGSWTIDKMHELAKQVRYMTGSTMTFSEQSNDTWGVIVQSYDCYALMLGANQPMVYNTGDSLSYRVNTEENVSTFQRVMDLVLDTENCGVADFYGSWTNGIYDVEYKIFANGHALFMPYTISTVSNQEMKDSSIHYGILPMPKANELQDDYTTSVTVYWCEVLSVPVSNVDKLEATCYALEAMAYYGKEIVTPEYYTRTLTYKRFADDDSAEMLDLIFRNRVYDPAGIFNFGEDSGGGTLGFYTNLLWARSADVTSTWLASESRFQASLDEFMLQLER